VRSPKISTATRVPETITISGDDLSADDAVTTLRRYGRWNLVKNSFVRFRYADGFTHARAVALQFCLSFIPLIIAIIGLSSALHQQKIAQVIIQTLAAVLPGSGNGDMMEQAAQRSQDQGATGGQLALWLGLLAAVVALTTAMGQIERGANRVYGIERDRPTMLKYGLALLMALTAGLLSLLGFLVIIAGDPLGRSLSAAYGWGDTFETLWTIGRWPVGVILAWGSFTVVLQRAPRRRQPGYSWLAFGGGCVACALAAVDRLARALRRSECVVWHDLRPVDRDRRPAALGEPVLSGVVPRCRVRRAARGRPRGRAGPGVG